MDAFAGLSFHSPLWLWLLVAAPLVAVGLVSREHHRRSLAERFVSERMRGHDRLRGWRPWIFSLGYVLAVVALAGPRVGYEEIDLPRSEANRILAVDVSSSMAADDVGTSRLDAAKALVREIVRRHDGKVALVIFEGKAVVVSPLTTDGDALVTLLESMQPGELSEPGSDLGAAVAESLRLIGVATASSDIVVISDGENRSDGWEAAVDRAKSAKVRVSAIVVGTEQGARIPAGDGTFLRDDNGEVVVTRASTEVSEKIAARTGGRLLVNPFAENALAVLDRHDSAESASKEKSRIPIERYQWPLGVAFCAFLAGSILHRGAD